MKTKLHLTLTHPTLWLTLGAALMAAPLPGQTLLDESDARHYASLTRQDGKLLEQLPLRIHADLDRATGLYEDIYGGLLIPDGKLTLDALEKQPAAPVPVAELWFRNLAPMNEDGVVPPHQLFLVKTVVEGESIRVPCCPIGVRRNGAGHLEMLVFGKGKDPLLTLPLRQVQKSDRTPVRFKAWNDYGDSGLVTLTLFGKYEAEFRVTELMP